MTLRPLRIGTRGSALALWQANHVKGLLEGAGLEPAAEITVIKTSGDRILNRSLIDIGGKGLFVKEIQTALISGEVDIAIHSLKDYPVENPEALMLACIPRREDPRDALVLPRDCGEKSLPQDARIGTGSLRRRYQAALLHPAWRVSDLRGNVQTRLSKVDGGAIDGAILAVAGLKRLGLEDRISRPFSLDEMVPAVGQGALAIEARREDREVLKILALFQDEGASLRVEAERRFLINIGGSCTTPIGIHGSLEGHGIVFRAFLASLDGSRHLKDQEEGPAGEAASLVDRLLQRLFERGAEGMMGGFR